jgi:murein L,D-transpeptidase YcbB/YkuD
VGARALTEITGAPVAAVRVSIKRQLDSTPPAPLTKETWQHAKRLYAQYAGGPLWFKSTGLDRERAGYLMRALANGDADALDLSAYPLSALGEALSALDKVEHPTPEQLATADMMLTAAYAVLGEDLLTGQISPRDVLQSWHIDPEEERIDSSLAKTLRSEPLDRAIATMRPADEGYAALQKELARYREIAARGGWGTVPTGRLVKPGEQESAARLSALRSRLAVEGILGDTTAPAPRAPAPEPQPTTADTGAIPQTPRPKPVSPRYDRQLAGAIAEFQRRHGIPVDSMLGPETVASLNVPVEYRLKQIAANMERHRWLPRTLGSRYILVNVPAFRLQAFDNGEVALDMKVIVGSDFEGRATPVFSDTMQFVVFRPYWNITDKIAENEIWPKVNADPGYAARNNYETYVDGGKTRIRQRPGDKNALGLVKFMFPNDFNIYLHDTPQDNLFEKDVRGFSHGCIRLEKPAELAQFVLGWQAGKVESAMESGSNNRHVNLPKSIPVYIAYFTTYVQDGQLFFGNDLYNRDEALAGAISGGAMPSDAAIKTAAFLRDIAERWTK